MFYPIVTGWTDERLNESLCVLHELQHLDGSLSVPDEFMAHRIRAEQLIRSEHRVALKIQERGFPLGPEFDHLLF